MINLKFVRFSGGLNTQRRLFIQYFPTEAETLGWAAAGRRFKLARALHEVRLFQRASEVLLMKANAQNAFHRFL